MAKSWKSFVPQTDNQEAEKELLQMENALQVSLEDLAKNNDALQAVLEEREELEAKMQQMLNPQDNEEENKDPRYSSAITPLSEKRKQEGKRFKQKQALEEKIALKNKELKAWEEKREKLNAKIFKTKNLVDRQKKRWQDFQRKAKKVKDNFDYDKEPKRIKKKVDDFPFKERVKNPKLKKLKSQWEDEREKLREAQTIKHKFKQRYEKLQAIKQEKAHLEKSEQVKRAKQVKNIADRLEQKKVQKADEKKKEENKKNLLERLKAKREETKEKKVKEKKEEPKEKKSLWEKREERKQQRLEKQKAEKKEASKREERREKRREERKNRKKDKYYN